MRVAIKKLDVADIGKLQALVIENIQGIEPGLTVLDSRLLLGHATIDLVAMDGNTSLVLVALGFSADEEMLLKAVEAYSWCLEYPEAIRRLYPAAQISESRPPRLIFVVGRVPDAFHRKIKQLGFPEIDCVEFRHLEVDGTAVLYFETVLQLRRSAASVTNLSTAVPQRAAQATASAVNGAHAGAVEPLRPALSVPSASSAAERPATAVPELPVVAPAALAAAVAPEATVLQAEPTLAQDGLTVPAPMPGLEPLAALLEQMAATAVPSSMIEPMPAAEPTPTVTLPTLDVADLVRDSLVVEAPPAPEPAAAPSTDATKEILGARSIEEAARAAFAAATPSFGDRQAPSPPGASTPTAPPVPPAPAAAKPQAEAETTKAAPLPQEFAGLNFPNDGVLTRQWMEFLNRMANSK
jgi:hypothetical protein